MLFEIYLEDKSIKSYVLYKNLHVTIFSKRSDSTHGGLLLVLVILALYVIIFSNVTKNGNFP